MKLLYLKTVPFDEKAAGGSITHTIGMVNGLTDAGAEVTVLGSEYIALMRAKQSLLRMKPFIRVPYLGNWLYAKRMKRAVKSWLKTNDESFDAIYGRYSMFNDAFLPIQKAKSSRFILEFNSFQVDSYRDIFIGTARQTHGKFVVLALRMMSPFVTAVIKKYENRLLRQADLIVAVSQILKDELMSRVHIPAEKVLVLPNGVDPDMFHFDATAGEAVRAAQRIPSRDVVVGYAGTFGNWHGIPELTDAFSCIARQTGISFLVMGDGALRPRMEKALTAFSQVHFTGLIPYAQMPAHFSACDILVISNSWNPESDSRFFGSPTKLFEYMSMGRAIVASDLEQINETLTNDETAVMYRTGDADSMCKAITSLIDDKVLRMRIGENARACAMLMHTWKANGETLLAYI